MPRGDRTGPWGAGPMTGRGAGYCAGYGAPGYMNPVGGRGYGLGFGRGWGGRFGGGGWGYRHQFYATGLPGWARAGYAPASGPAPAAPTEPQAAPILGTQGPHARKEPSSRGVRARPCLPLRQ